MSRHSTISFSTVRQPEETMESNFSLVLGEESTSLGVASQDREFDQHEVVTSSVNIGKHTDLELPPCSPRRAMDSSCDPTLRRSVLLHKAMRRLGVHFASNQGSAKEFSLSEQTSEIDDFISHDWRTGRWSKVCSMLLVYNCRLAIFASNLVAIFVCALQTDAVGLLPRKGRRRAIYDGSDKIYITVSFWCVAVSGPIFLLFFCFGHNLAVLFSRGAGQQRVFVDKLCICQTNEQLKTKGIQSLAGILKQSRRLVILWSPRYFKRLWCVYELASWMHDQTKHHQPKPIRFEPVAWGHIIPFVWAIAYSLCLLWLVQAAHFGRPTGGALFELVLAGILFIGFVMAMLHLRLFTQELALIADQLEKFHVEACECFCCNVGHTHPETGVSIPCDRELIYETMNKWANSTRTPSHGSDGTPPMLSRDESNCHFDFEVKLRLKQWAENSVGLAPLPYFPYDYALFALIPSTWHAADHMADALSKNLTAAAYAMLFLEFAWWNFMYLPIVMKLGMFLHSIISRRCPTTRCSCAVNVLVTLATTAVAFSVASFVWYLMHLLRQLRNHVPYILAVLAWLFVAVAIFNIDRLWLPGRGS